MSSVSPASRSGPTIIAVVVIALLILHQDNWFWNDGTLVLGFLPIGLFWHLCLSVAASLTWFAATKIAWPLDPATVAALTQETQEQANDSEAAQ